MEILPLDNQYQPKGNIIPDEWYKKFTNVRGAPDLPLISVLAEIVYWYRPKKLRDPVTDETSYVNKFSDDAWQTSYQHFEKKFGFNHEKLRRVFVRLESMGIATREFRTVCIKGQSYNNRLFVHLNKEFLKLYGDNGKKRKNNKSADSKNDSLLSSKENFFSSQGELIYPQNEPCSPHLGSNIDKNNKKNNKNRSTEDSVFEQKTTFCRMQAKSSGSNFYKNSFEEEIQTQQTTNQIKLKFAKALELKDFYPLTREDCQILQSSSKRAFSLNAMNEILLDMSKRLSDRYFRSKKVFLNYMSKVFTYEKRDVAKISNESFKIKNNKTENELISAVREKYLTEIEYSLEVSPEWHFKKKLAARLERKAAYDLLKAFKVIDIREGVFNLHLSKHVELTDTQKWLILQEAKATNEHFDFEDARLGFINELKIIMPENPSPIKVAEQKELKELSADIWKGVRSSLILIYDEETDRNWFSKITPYVDESLQEIKLKVPTGFVRDWINQNYLQTIRHLVEDFYAKENYQWGGVVV
jgi:DnaA N-terminal domain